MNWKIKILVLLTFVCSCQKQDKSGIAESNEYLISAKELKATKHLQDIKILDFRKVEDYNKGHIDGAIQIWRSDIQDTSYPYQGMMATPQQLENLFSKLGITYQDTLVIYDESGLCEAARLWWILQNYNFKKVKLLTDGLKGWQAIQGKITVAHPIIQTSDFRFQEPTSMKYHAGKNEVLKAIKNNWKIIDTRSSKEFNGAQHKKGAAKAGRIKNSIHLDWAESINYDTDKSIKSISELEKIYARLGAKKTDSIILYCHSGVRSAHTTFILTQLLGYKNVWNYDGSWTEWSHFDELPIENESLTL